MLKKFGEKITKKGLLIAGGIAIALVATIIAIAIISSKGEGTKKKSFTPDSELARAMTYDQFSDDDANIDGTDYVKFGAFFLRDINNDGYAEKIKGTCKQVGKEDTLYMELNVLTNGYLENGVITINSDNFYLQTAIPKDSEVKDNVISNNTKQISLNQINNGTQKLLTGIVRTGDYSYDSQKFAAIGNDTTKMSKVNSVTLTGTHVAADGTRTQISKTVEFNMDWYGTTKAEIPSYVAGSSNLSQSKDNTNVVDEKNKQAVFEFDIGMQETNNQLILSKAHLEGTIPQLNGYDPSKVEIVDSNATFSYEEATKTFQAEKLTELNTDRTVSKQCYDGTYYENRYNKFKLKVTYPLDAYNATGNDTVEIKIPVSGYYEGYNNTNTEFKKQHKSNIARGIIVLNYSRPTGSVARFDVVVGKYMVNPYLRYIVSKRNPLKIYNEISTEENNDTYIVKWYGSTGSEGQSAGMIMKETKNGDAQVSDQFIKIDSTTESMENITTNIGIYFGNPVNLLGENGWIKVYDDETGNLLHEFTKSDWSDYTENNPYKYNVQVKHVRVETSETNPNQLISIYHVKNLDDEYITKNYTREQFDNLKYIKSTLTGYVGNSYINTDTHSAYYEAPYSFAKISLSKNAISTQETEKDMQIKIEAMGDENANQEKWQNGAFLVKLPKDIVDIDVSSVVSSTSSVIVMSYESFEENGERFIKIITSNTNPTTFTLTINCSVTPDPRIATTSEIVELYASNENGVDYYNPVEDIYDVNDNLNQKEKVNKSTVSLSLISPNSLLTNQVATNYDENGSVTVAPQIAIVSKERRNATVNVEINNNYSSTISEVKILGRVPFEGNKYTINGQEMGSTFTATMTNEGIQLPIALKDVAKVYYSTNGEATQDLTNAQNEWTQTPSDYSKVKSYLIDLGDHQLVKGEKQSISYNINIPAGLAYNKVAYSHHAVYFNLDTAEGKYRTQTEPNKIGFMIAKQYDLELTKYQKGKSKIVSGATYAVYEAGNEEVRTRVTGVDGKLKLTGLYIDKTYVVKEVKSPDDYELNEEVVKFTTSESDGKLNVTKNEGTVKNIQAVQPTATEGYKVQLEVEDEVKVRFKIKKTEKGSTTVVQGIGYKLIGAGLPTNGKNMTTNANGEITVKGLKVGEEYTLEEIKAEGYYVAKGQIKFTVTNTDGTYTINVSQGTVKASNITEEDSIPTVNIELEDEKIPTYNLEISKIQRITSTAVTEDELKAKAEQALSSTDTVYLSGAKFKLYKGTKELGSYITDENGKITLNNLYQYIDGKDEEATYTLKETLSPEGYSKVKDIIFKVDGSTGELKFVNTEGKEESYTVENNTVKLLIEDSPSFKLIKKDAETNELLANIKFAIYDVEEGTEPAKNSKGEIIGTKETINGKEYYTVTTDSKGEITADLSEGMYKAVEVQAPDKYDISEPYYFGIGTSREGKIGYKAAWAQGIGGISSDSINSVAVTRDGGYIVGGYFSSSNIDLGNGVSLANANSYADGMIIKYSSSGEVEWAQGIGGKYDDYIESVAVTSDGGYIVGGYFSSSNIDLGNGVSLTNKGSKDGMIIKYNVSGEVEWAQGIGGPANDQIKSIVSTRDGGYIVGGYFYSDSIDLGNGIILSNNTNGTRYADGMVIKYSSSGEAEWAQGIGGPATDQIKSIVSTRDGGYIVGGYFYSSSLDLENGVSLTNKGSADGMIIKYSSNGKVEWAQGIGGTNEEYIKSVAETSNGGYIVGGYFESSSIDLGNGISLTNKGYSNGMVIKYSQDGEVEWAKGIGGIYGDYIRSVAECRDGSYIVGGNFESTTINLENGISLTNKGKGHSDGMVIKYSSNGEVEWAEGIGGTDSDYINSVAECSDGGYIIGGDFCSSSIDLGNGISLTNHKEDSYDGMVIKLEETELPNPTIVQGKEIGGDEIDQITSVVPTSDGGYIVGGYFNSSSIDLGDGVVLSNKGSNDGMIIKYSNTGIIEWSREIGGENDDFIESVIETVDGGYIAVGKFKSYSIDLGNGVNLYNKGYDDGIVIKYNFKGEAEWAQSIYGSYITSVSKTNDGGCILVGAYSSSIDLGNGVNLTNKRYRDVMTIKYSASGEVEWAQGIGGVDEDIPKSVLATSDGGYLVGGYFKSNSIDLGSGVSLTNNGSENGILIKYNNNGEVEWAHVIGGEDKDRINSITELEDGSYIAVGEFKSSNIDLDNGINLTNATGYTNGMIIKCNSKGETEWAKEIKGNFVDTIKSVTKTSDGGYIIGENFYSSSLELENGETLTNNGECDVIIIKYSCSGKIEWIKGIGGKEDDQINSIAETKDGDYMIGGYFGANSIDLGNGKALTNKSNPYSSGFYPSDGMILRISDQQSVPEVQELEVTNKRKEFKITTDVNEIDGIKGGAISGEDRKPYENVKYGDSSTKEIKMVPDENYEIIGITVNGNEYKFTKNADGSYTMPQFKNITEDKHIVVTYSLKDNKITINKIDKDTKAKLSGAKFKLDQIEERAKPNAEEIIGSLTDNGQEYAKTKLGNEITGKLGELTNNGTYYFVKNADGTYTPTNSKTYQTANGGTGGISSSTANSYISIDLTGLTGTYAVVINASCSSETNYDYGYATVTETSTAPAYDSATGRFIYVSGISNAMDYNSVILEGGKTYYLHLGYRKDWSGDRNNDQVVINSIKLYNATSEVNVYNFINNNGKYESTNIGKDDTVANSYIPIDLTKYTEKYDLTVNAEISSESSDYGYVTITENTTRPSYSSSMGRMVYISGIQSAKDYTTVLQGGKMYYLHLGYYKDSTISSANDKFTVNSVNISLNNPEIYNTTVETNSDGQAITQIPFGKYNVTEIKAPEGYILNSTPTVIEFKSANGAIHEFTIEDEAKAKLVVHHYIKGTTIQLADDENSEANAGDSYITNPKLDLDKYELEKDSNGEFILPTNAVGKYKTGTTEVTYYYVEKTIPLTVHHYIEGTTDRVPLKAGGTASDVTGSGKEGESYTTSAIEDGKLSDEYELVETPSNANGTYTGNEVVVTYYYKKVARDVNLIKYQEDGATPLEGAKFTIKSKDDSENNDVIKAEEIQNNGTYYFKNSSGKYVSNNQNKSNTTANSYMKIDMTKASEDATITVNAEISSESNYDYGYATITQAETAPAYNTSTGRFVYISGTQSAKDYSTTLAKGKVYYLHLGYRKDDSGNTGADTFTVNSIKINGVDYLTSYYTTNTNGKIQTKLEAGRYEVTEIEAPEGYKLPDNPTTEITISKATTSEDITITNEKKTGTVTVHHYVEGTTTPVPLLDGSTATDEIKTGNVGDMYASMARTDISEGYELVVEPDNASGTYIDGNIDVIYYYKTIPTSVVVHHYLEGTTTKLAEDVKFDGIVGDNYTTGVGNVDNKYELVAIPTNANGKMTRNQIEVIYYYRLKDTSVLVHHYKEGTSESLSADVTINGKVDDEYTTTVATDIPSKYELVAEPDNKAGMMTVEQTVVTYYYRLKETGVDVHYYKEGTTEKISEDVEIIGRVDDTYTTTPATNVASKYELIEAPANATGTMTEDRITVIYYYRLKDTSVLVHHYLEGTTTSLSPDETINGQVDDTYRTVEATDLLFGNYDLVEEPNNKTGIMTEDQIVVTYYYRLKDASVLVHHYIKDTTTSLSADVTINGRIEDAYITTIANDIPEQYELVEMPANATGTMTKEQIVVTYYYQLKNYPYVVNYLEKDTDKVLHEAKQGGELVYGSTVNSVDEKIEIDGYKFDSFNQDVLTIGTSNNVINIYYTKRTDLSYKVNYLEKTTNKVLHNQKTVENKTFGDTVNSVDEKLDIDGYNYDSVDKETLTITTGENVINIYYTKRNDLNYKVNYLEKTTNKVLHDQKTVENKTFGDTVNSADEKITIDGYNYDSVDKDTLTITTGENVINIYYTKRNDLSYKVNYLEKGTNKVLHDSKSQGNMTFESTVKSSDEVIDINGYNYDSVDKDTLTITTGENVINIYYTKKDTKVTVHYYEEGTTNKVSEDVEIPGKVFDDYTTTSADDIPSKYELVAEPENKNGIMTEDEITVIYYYRKKATQVIVHYYEENTTKKLSEDVTINGRVDDKYTTVSAEDIPIKYELVATPSNANGSMTEETIEVIYYYRVKDAVVHVRYLEKGTDKVLADPDRIDGKVDDDYQTSAKEIEGYKLIEHTGNEKGKFEVEPLTVTYYYLYETKATVQYIDKITGQILEQSTTEGLEGDDFVTESKDFENYVLVEEPPEKTVKMTKEEQILKYYYMHVSGGVIEKHIDVISGQILANAVHNGNEGDEYDIPSRTFDGYDLVEDRLPSNAKGTMKVEPVEVIYYYIYRSKVTSEYIDKNTGNKLTDDVVQKGHEGDNYTTERKTFDDYKLVEVPSNADGSMTKEDIKVTYYYVHISGGVIVNHVDIKTGKQLLDETKEEGYEGDPYETHEENIPEYDLVKDKYPENATGKMTIEPTRVTYYYIKKTEVNIKYVDKETGEEIDEPTNIPGHEGDDYTTEPKDVPGYDLVEEPENKDGTMTADPIDVIYYYKRPAKVIVNYYDIDTKEKLADEIEIDGHQNDDYTTEQKDIKYYKVETLPVNKDGKMTVTVTKDENGKEIVEDTTYVNYYYRKLIFNLRVDKTIASVIVNGQETVINGTLGKVEVHRKNISTANVKVVYKIKVTNDSELSGKANVVENIPSGMTMIADNNPGWTINETTASVETDEIKPGESREYQVVLGWQNGDGNIGTKENVASIVTENEAGFNEKDASDNESRADLIVAVGTGEIPYVAIAGSILLIMISITAGVYVISKKRQ